MTKENLSATHILRCETLFCPCKTGGSRQFCNKACNQENKNECIKGHNSDKGISPLQNSPIYRNPTPGKIPIQAMPFTNDVEYMAKVEDFRALADAGFNLSSAHLGHMNPNSDQNALMAAAGKVKLFLSYAWIGPGQSLSEQNRLSDDYFKDLKNYNVTSYAGASMCDEPSLKMLTCCRHDSLLNRYKRVQELFLYYKMSDCLQRINMLPVEAFNSVEKFQEYIDTFEYYYKPAFLTYDSYPIMKHEPLFNLSKFANNFPGLKHSEYLQKHEYFYRNLELFSAQARNTGKPFWAYVMSNSHMLGDSEGFYPTPLENHLRFEVFSALAYGAKGLAYWRYLQAEDYTEIYFHAPVNYDGTRNTVWYLARRINREIERYTDVFLETTVQKVCHTNIENMMALQARYRGLNEDMSNYSPMLPIRIESDPDIPDANGEPTPFKIYDTHWGLTPLSSTSMPVISDISSDGLGVLVSHLRKSVSAPNYIVIVNHDALRAQEITISFKSGKMLDELTPLNSGAEPPASKINTSLTPSVSRLLPAGGYIIFRWRYTLLN